MTTTPFETALERVLSWGPNPVRSRLRNAFGRRYGVPVDRNAEMPPKVWIAKYFRPTPDESRERAAVRLLTVVGPLVLLGSLVTLLMQQWVVAGLLGLVGLGVLGVGWTALTTYWRDYAAAEPKPTDATMDRFLDDQVGAVAAHAMSRLGLTLAEIRPSEEFDPEGAAGRAPTRLAEQRKGPLTLIGLVLDGHRGRLGGEDNTWRFPVYDIMVICPTRSYLEVFECRWDMRKESRSDEEIREYHYDDVALLSMVNKSHELDVTPKELANRDVRRTKVALVELQIVATAGERDRSEIVLPVEDPSARARAIRVVESRMRAVIPALKGILRTTRRRPA